MIQRFVNFLIRFRRLNFLIICATLLISVFLIKPIKINGNLEIFFIKNNPYTESLHKIESFYPHKNNIQIQVTPNNGSISRLIQSLQNLDSLLSNEFPDSKIQSIHNAADFIFGYYSKDSETFAVLDSLSKIPLLQQLISADHRHILMIFYVSDSVNFDLGKFNHLIHQNFEGIERIIALSQYHIESQLTKSIQSDLIKISLYVLILISMLILLVFRDIKALFLILINCGFSFIPLLLLFTLLSIDFNMLTVMTVSLVLIFSLCDSVHLLNSYYHTAFIADKTERIKYSLRRLIIPCFFTSFTTAIAFLSFLFNDSDYIREFGIISASVVMCEFGITFFTFPFLMQLLQNKQLKNHFLDIISNEIVGNKKIGGAILITILLVSLFFIRDLNFKTDFESFFPVNTELRKDHDEFTRNFQSFIGMDILIEKKGNSAAIGLKQLTIILSKELAKMEEVKKVNSYKDQLDFQQKYLSSYYFTPYSKMDDIFISGDKSRIQVAVKSPTDVVAIKTGFDEMSKKYSGDYDFSVFSPALLFSFIDESVSKSLLKSFISSAIVILLVFIFFTKTIRNTLVSMLANLIPIGSLIMMFVLFRINLNIGTAMTAVICLGIIVDDTIHILYRKLILGEELKELTHGLFLTSFFLTVSFLLFMISDFQPTKNFGFLSGCVFIVAYLSDMIILNWLLKIKSGR